MARGLPRNRILLRSSELHERSEWRQWRYLLPASAIVDIPQHGVSSTELRFERGGILELSFLAPLNKRGNWYGDDYLLEANLRNEQGKSMPVKWYDPDPSGVRYAQSVLTSADGWTSTALPTGRYQLLLKSSFESVPLSPVSLRFEIVPGETTTASVLLRN